MTVATGLPEHGFLRLAEWCRRPAKDPDVFRFADPAFELTADSAPARRVIPEQRMFHVCLMRESVKRMMEVPCV